MKTATLVSILLVAGAAGTASGDIQLSSLDDFSVNSEGWSISGAGSQPTRNPGTSFDGQPGFLSHFSDGVGPNSKWLMWSVDSDWRGNYNAAGVSAISLWADNRAGNPLDLRIAFNGPGGWFYSAAKTITDLTAGDDWTHLVYDLANFTHVGASGGTGVFADTITGVTRFEILGGSDEPKVPAFGAPHIQAGNSVNTVWIDNVAAVPEPSSMLLFLLGCAGTVLALKRKRDN